MMTLITQLEMVFVRFLHSEVKLLFSPFYTVLFGKKSLCTDHPSGVGSYSLSPWGHVEYLHNFYFWILVHGKFVSFTYLVMYLDLYGFMDIHGYFFYALGYNSMTLYFTAQLVPTLAIGSSFGWLLCHFDTLLSICVCVCVCVFVCVSVCVHVFLSTSWLSGTKRCCRLILYISCLSPRISHFSKESWFLYQKNGIRH